MSDPGRKLAGASFFVFCTLNELEAWIRMLSAEKELGCISFTGSLGMLANSPDEIRLSNDTYAAFLYPRLSSPTEPLDMNNVNARAWGWITIRPGGLQEVDSTRVLLYSEIHGEDFENDPVHPAKFVRWLKRQLTKSRKCGVLGKNMEIEGGEFYHAICYTPSAYELYLSGVVWKQFPDGRVIFMPPEDTL